jgi:hypothetical protein
MTTPLMLVLIVFFLGSDSGSIKAMLQVVQRSVGLLLWTAYDMAYNVFGAKKLGWGQALAHGWDKLLFVVVAFMLLTFTKVNPAIVILSTAVLGFILYR